MAIKVSAVLRLDNEQYHACMRVIGALNADQTPLQEDVEVLTTLFIDTARYQ